MKIEKTQLKVPHKRKNLDKQETSTKKSGRWERDKKSPEKNSLKKQIIPTTMYKKINK